MTDKNQNTRADELGWDDDLEDIEFITLPEGEATFEVTALNRTRKEKGKLGECNVAVLTLLVTHTESGETATFDEELPLHKKLMFLLLQFFTAIGQREHGEEGPFTPNWSKKAIIGATGRCVLDVRTWTKKDQSEGSANQIKSWIAPGDETSPLPF